MIRFKEARKRDVVTTDDAETIGRVDTFLIDPATQHIMSLRLSKVKGAERFLSWRDVTSFGRDVVTVANDRALRQADGPREEGDRKEFDVLGKLVLTDAGRELGEVEDVEFDPEDGRVHALLTKSDEVAGDRIRGIGSYAVVVSR